MPDITKEMNQRAMATATRLRQIQADSADEDPDSRQGYLSDEVERAVAELVPNQRQLFLDALKEHFPTWDANMTLHDQSASSSATLSPTDLREWQDVNFVLERLIELSGTLPPDKKKRLIRQLAGAGLIESGVMSIPEEVMEELRSCLQLEADQTFDSARLAEMALRLANLVQSLDQLVWQIWKNVSPRTKLRSTRLQTLMHQFVKGDADVPLTRDLEQLRHLTASLLSAIAQIGVQFGQVHLARFAPSEIENAVAKESGGMFVAKEVKCWRKYTQLSKTMDDPAAIDSQVKQIIADFVESMRGLGK